MLLINLNLFVTSHPSLEASTVFQIRQSVSPYLIQIE